MLKTKPLALVAENTELGRWAIAHALQASGYEIYMSASWTESDGWLDQAEFDVAVMSVSCDRDDVARIAGHLRSHHVRTGLILLALQDDVGSVRRACGSGPLVLAKPLDIPQIVLAVRSLAEPGEVATGV